MPSSAPSLAKSGPALSPDGGRLACRRSDGSPPLIMRGINVARRRVMVYERLDWGAHWRTMNENLIELVDLLPEEKLDWVPREAEWAAPTIFAHIAMARHMGPLGTPEAIARIGL